MMMSEEMAVRLHRMMWSDMQKELGDRPSGNDRLKFKREWVERNFPGERIPNDCWLCEYASSVMKPGDLDSYCKHCPISWPKCHCYTLDFSYAEEPISEILALPAKNESFDKTAANIHDLSRDIVVGEVAKASGLPVECDIWSHIKAIQDKAKEKAVEEYFEKQPAAKMVSMDVDDAFKQYADEQKAPIFHALAEASGLSASNESVKAHINLIRDMAKQNGRAERSREVFSELAKASGLPEGKRCVSDHVKAIQVKASHEKDMELLRKTSMQLADKLNRYKDALSKESDLDRNRPVDDHIKKIVEDSFNEGRDYERERIMDKVGEMLNK